MQQQQQQQRRPAAGAAGGSKKSGALITNKRSSSSSSSSATAAGAAPQQQPRRQHQRKKQQSLRVSELPEAASAAHPSLLRSLRGLEAAEEEIHEATERLLTSLRDAQTPCINQPASRQTLPLLLSRRRLRVFIYNTHHQQQQSVPSSLDPHAPHFQLPPLHTLQQQQQQQQVGLSPPTLTSLVHEPPPSWCLHIKGQSIDKQANCCLSSFFERILVLSGSETIAWRWGGGTPVEELVIQRRGEEALKLKILFFVKYRLPTFSLSPQLSAVCGGQRQLSLCAVLRGVFSYCLSKGLLLPTNSPGSTRAAAAGGRCRSKQTQDRIAFATDETLKRLFGADCASFSLADVPVLLRQHLLPPQPVVICHDLRLSGDWTESEQTFDFSLDCIDSTCGSGSACSGSSSSIAAVGAAASACCVLGLDAWISSPQQNLTQQQQHKHLALDAELDSLDIQMSQILAEIRQRAGQLELYRQFAESPTKVSLLVDLHLSLSVCVYMSLPRWSFCFSVSSSFLSFAPHHLFCCLLLLFCTFFSL